ncbi:OmpA family protein [Flagellimonas meishanensis]|uniref:OmpA family protein n=1 Tax=Flagellimonas meishanensis TaxID=2873264 RepID=UPI001CA6A286|nr:OmpA family protein [[Muricauda] meishanensis]
MYRKISITFLFAGLFTLGVQAQKSNINKANEVFEAYAYIDAREIYLKVVKSGYESAQIYKNLGDTYYFNGEYSDAVQWYKRLIDKYPTDLEPEYYYRTAQCYKSIGEYHESKKMMGKFASLSSTTNLANNFMEGYPRLDSLVYSTSEKYEVVNITDGLSSSDFGPAFYQDKLVYASSSKNTKGSKTHEWTGLRYLDLFEATLDDESNLANPTPLKGDINTPYHESTPAFTKDGKTVYFTRNNYLDGKKRKNKDREITLKIYKAEKKEDGSWTNVTELPFNNDGYATAHPALSPDEKRLYFSSDRSGGRGKSDLWYVEILGNNSYGAPKNLGPDINTEARETFPYISKNNILYFASDGHLGLGGLDIFAISLDGDSRYQNVTNLKKPINSNYDDFGFIMDEEKQIGFLSSNRTGGEGSASDDIYKVRESCAVQSVQGVITDAKTKLPLQGALVTLLNEDNEKIAQTISSADGSYTFDDLVGCNKQYSVRGEYEEMEYSPTEKTITVRGDKTKEVVDLQLSPSDCPPNDLGCRLTLQPIYFDYGRYAIRPDAEVELAKILEAMKEYPQLKIHIESHTDSRSSDGFNMRLSHRRAQATLQWFVNNGIERSRLSAKGYGETRLLNKCSNGVRCSDAEHQLNRRSMFIIKE